MPRAILHSAGVMLLRLLRLLRLFLLLAVTAPLQGCAFLYSLERERRYSLVRVSDIEGHTTAEWIAEGFVSQTNLGYQFRAVERVSGPPLRQEIHYPLRRRVEIGGVNIVVSRCGKPRWLYEMEGP